MYKIRWYNFLTQLRFLFPPFSRCSDRTHVCKNILFCIWLLPCVTVWDHVGFWQLGSSALSHLLYGSGGVPVFCWCSVWMGFSCLCPEDRGLLQLSLRQRHRSQWNTDPRSVWFFFICSMKVTCLSIFSKPPTFLSVSTDCSVQDEQFSLVFTIASFLNNFFTLPSGFLFDQFGTLVARLFGMWVQLLYYHVGFCLFLPKLSQ